MSPVLHQRNWLVSFTKTIRVDPETDGVEFSLTGEQGEAIHVGSMFCLWIDAIEGALKILDGNKERRSCYGYKNNCIGWVRTTLHRRYEISSGKPLIAWQNGENSSLFIIRECEFKTFIGSMRMFWPMIQNEVLRVREERKKKEEAERLAEASVPVNIVD